MGFEIMKLITVTNSSKETEKCAAKFAKTLKPGSVLLLIGDLGSGKTTFVRGLARGLGISPKTLIHSPSFTLVNEYAGSIPLFHVDLYRLGSIKEVEELDLENYLERGGVLAVEWANRFSYDWTRLAVEIHFNTLSPREREISFYERKENEKGR